MKRINWSRGAGLDRATAYWLSLAGFVVFIVITFLLFEPLIIEVLNTARHKLWTRPSVLLSLLLLGLLAFDVLLPVPSTLVAVIAVTLLGPTAGGLTVFLGLCLGALLGYLLGSGWSQVLNRLPFDRETYRADNGSMPVTPFALIILRGVPVLAETSVVAAGMSRYPLRRFLLITGSANVGLALVYGYLGNRVDGQHSLLLTVIACAALPTLLYLIHRLGQKLKSGQSVRRTG